MDTEVLMLWPCGVQETSELEEQINRERDRGAREVKVMVKGPVMKR